MSPAQAIDFARAAADLLVSLAEVAGADPKELVDAAAVKRANDLADLAEDVKFGPEKER